jgi:hypothetical protein
MNKEKVMEELLKPFPQQDVEWRIQRSGTKVKGEGEFSHWAMVLAYITNRAIMERLDKVFGVLGWQNEYKTAPDGGVLCGISVYDSERNIWVTKWDGAENTTVEAIKGGLSGSMKRAGVQWGIGRYLYKLDTTFVKLGVKANDNSNYEYCNINEKGCIVGGNYNGKTTKKKLAWNTPNLPDWAVGETF